MQCRPADGSQNSNHGQASQPASVLALRMNILSVCSVLSFLDLYFTAHRFPTCKAIASSCQSWCNVLLGSVHCDLDSIKSFGRKMSGRPQQTQRNWKLSIANPKLCIRPLWPPCGYRLPDTMILIGYLGSYRRLFPALTDVGPKFQRVGVGRERERAGPIRLASCLIE